MVEFDDGDRGRISLANIRLLPPGYQICCEHERRRGTTETKNTNLKKNRRLTILLLVRCGTVSGAAGLTWAPQEAKQLRPGEERHAHDGETVQ